MNEKQIPKPVRICGNDSVRNEDPAEMIRKKEWDVKNEFMFSTTIKAQVRAFILGYTWANPDNILKEDVGTTEPITKTKLSGILDDLFKSNKDDSHIEYMGDRMICNIQGHGTRPPKDLMTMSLGKYQRLISERGVYA